MKEQILIVDDDNDILELLEYNLNMEGFDVLGFLTTKHVRNVLLEEKIDLIIMDRSLPDIEGCYYIEMLRNKGIEIPVIILSAKDTIKDIKEGFLKGADDYITKPFDMGELILRIKAVLKRSKPKVKESINNVQYRDIKLNLNLHSVSIDNAEITLTNLEMTLLHTLISNRGKVLDREFLIKHVWKKVEDIHLKTVNVAIKRLKEKIDPDKTKDYIKSIRGIGYLVS